MAADPIITVKLDDVAKVYNDLLEHKEMKWIKDMQDDPSFKDPLT